MTAEIIDLTRAILKRDGEWAITQRILDSFYQECMAGGVSHEYIMKICARALEENPECQDLYDYLNNKGKP